MPPPTSLILTPASAARTTLTTGLHHLSEPLSQALVKNLMGSLLLSAGSLLAQILSHGFPTATASNPGLQRLLSGAAFPVGLIIVYALGAELFTGYPMWYFLTICVDYSHNLNRGTGGKRAKKLHRTMQYLRSVLGVWLANLAGALMFAGVFCVSAASVTEQPWRDGILALAKEDLVDLAWGRIFLRSVACGWLVTVAMVLGERNQDGVGQALGLWLPFAVSTSARFMHTVEYMFVGGLACMLGSELGWIGYCWRCLLPVTLGNIVGGGLITGGYLWVVYLKGPEAEKAVREEDGDREEEAEGLAQENGFERFVD